MSKLAPKSPGAPVTAPAEVQKAPELKAAPQMSLVLRENDAIKLAKIDAQNQVSDVKTIVSGNDVSECDMAFHSSRFAFADLSTVSIAEQDTGVILHKLDAPKCVHVAFSPAGTYLVTYAHPDPKREGGNMTVYKVADGTIVLQCTQRLWPALYWSFDEKYCLRPVNGVLQLLDGALEAREPLQNLELQLPHDKTFELTLCRDQPLVALFKPHHKQTQASLRVFRLPSLKDEMLNLNFGRAEGASIAWSASGAALSLTLRMERDKSGQSYYGTSSLLVVQVRDRTAVTVPLGAGEGVHDVQWSPVADEFVLIHGIMPKNKATIYNSKAQPLFSLGEAPRNTVLWSPNGKMFVLGGVGNLAGEFQFYDRDALGSSSNQSGGKLGFFSEKSSVQAWTPDSRHLLCSTIFSRLRVDNKIVLWKHTGERLSERKFATLHESSFVPVAADKFPVRRPSPTVAPSEKPKAAAYRPPVASAAAAALLARPSSASATVKPSGPVGAKVVDPKKKVKR